MGNKGLRVWEGYTLNKNYVKKLIGYAWKCAALYRRSNSFHWKRGSDHTEESFCEIESDCASSDPMDDVSGAVKVLKEKTGSYYNFQNERLDSEMVPMDVESFPKEFRDLLRLN